MNIKERLKALVSEEYEQLEKILSKYNKLMGKTWNEEEGLHSSEIDKARERVQKHQVEIMNLDYNDDSENIKNLEKKISDFILRNTRTIVKDKWWKDEKIKLTGYKFMNCRFENCTLVADQNNDYELLDCYLTKVHFKTEGGNNEDM